jgi:putative component of toxin-antitoxin plasmid stabilization module
MAVMLVFVRDGTYEMRLDMGSGSMIYIPSLMETGTGVQAILGFCLSSLNGCNVGITDGRDL